MGKELDYSRHTNISKTYANKQLMAETIKEEAKKKREQERLEIHQCLRDEIPEA